MSEAEVHENGNSSPQAISEETSTPVKSELPPPPPPSMDNADEAGTLNGANDHLNSLPPMVEDQLPPPPPIGVDQVPPPQPVSTEDIPPAPVAVPAADLAPPPADIPLPTDIPLPADIPPPVDLPPPVDVPPPPPSDLALPVDIPPAEGEDAIPPISDLPPPPPADFPLPPPPRVYSEEEQAKAATKIQGVWRKYQEGKKPKKSGWNDAPVSTTQRLVAPTKARTSVKQPGRRAPTRGKKVESKSQSVPDKVPEAEPSVTEGEERPPEAAKKPRPVTTMGLPMGFNPGMVQLKSAPRTSPPAQHKEPAQPFPLVKLKSAPRPMDMTGDGYKQSDKHASMQVMPVSKKEPGQQKAKASSAFLAPLPPPLKIEEEPKPAESTPVAPEPAQAPAPAPAPIPAAVPQETTTVTQEPTSTPAQTPAATPAKKKGGLFGWLSNWLGKRPSKQELVDKNILQESGGGEQLSAKERKKKEKEDEKERKRLEKEKKKLEKKK